MRERVDAVLAARGRPVVGRAFEVRPGPEAEEHRRTSFMFEWKGRIRDLASSLGEAEGATGRMPGSRMPAI